MTCKGKKTRNAFVQWTCYIKARIAIKMMIHLKFLITKMAIVVVEYGTCYRYDKFIENRHKLPRCIVQLRKHSFHHELFIVYLYHETVFEFYAGYCPRTWYTTPSDYDSKTCIRFGPSHSVTIAIFERIKPISTKDYHMLVFVRYTFIFPCTICKITFRLHHCLPKRYYTEEDTISE